VKLELVLALPHPRPSALTLPDAASAWLHREQQADFHAVAEPD